MLNDASTGLRPVVSWYQFLTMTLIDAPIYSHFSDHGDKVDFPSLTHSRAKAYQNAVNSR